MKDGGMRVQMKNGEIVSVGVAAGLTQYYERLFAEAEADLDADKPDAVGIGIRLVVFGTMWIEGLCNEWLLYTLQEKASLRAETSDAMWVAIERVSTLQKLRVLKSFAAEPERSSADWIAPLQEVFKLRNSLVHFKDKTRTVAADMTLEELETQRESFPEAELISRLKKPALDTTVQAIRIAIEHLSTFFIVIELQPPSTGASE